MSDGLPTDEQLDRIAAGVRIRLREHAERRRQTVRGLAGAAVVVALLAGVIGLVRFGGVSNGSGASTAGGAGSGPLVAVECHAGSGASSAARRTEVPEGIPADRVAQACGAAAVDFQSGTGRVPSAASGSGSSSSAPGSSSSGSAAPSARPSGAVVCRADDGRLHVFPADAHPRTLCSRNGMTDY